MSNEHKKINDVNDMLVAAGEALTNTDTEALDDLLSLNREWLQDETAREAMDCMLHSMLEMAHQVNDNLTCDRKPELPDFLK